MTARVIIFCIGFTLMATSLCAILRNRRSKEAQRGTSGISYVHGNITGYYARPGRDGGPCQGGEGAVAINIDGKHKVMAEGGRGGSCAGGVGGRGGSAYVEGKSIAIGGAGGDGVDEKK